MLVGLIMIAGMVGAAAGAVAYAHRWMVTAVAGEQSIAPPLKLLWDRSPIWFERWNPGGFSESPSRRLTMGPDGFVTVVRRNLYGLDRRTGRVQWRLPLRGEEIFDWQVLGDTFVYASYGRERYERFWGIRAAIDLRQRREIWVQTPPTPYLLKEWCIVYGRLVVFGNDAANEVVALGLADGTERWKAAQQGDHDYVVRASWFVQGDVLYVLAGHKKQAGLFLKSFDLANGRELPLVHLFGNDVVSNIYVPSAIIGDDTLLAEYDAFRVEKSSIIAYDIRSKRLRWETELDHGMHRKDYQPWGARRIAVSTIPGEPVMATYRPNRYVLLDPLTGVVLKDTVLPGYVGWTDHNAVLYSYPYLFTSGRRAIDTGMAYDLVALNLETGKVDWAREIERRSETFLTARAEILNFLAVDRDIYLARSDANTMAFRGSSRPR
jgi:outer membrane protein assembly factor BamB